MKVTWAATVEGVMSNVPLAVLLLPASLLLVGCAVGVRAGASPTIDTRGHLGAQVYVGGTFGLTDNARRRAWLCTGEAAVGGTRGTGAAAVVAGGVDYLALDRSAWRAGLRWGIGTELDPRNSFGKLGMAAALLPGIDGDSSDYRSPGVELRVSWLGGAGWDDVIEVGIGGVYELHVLENIKVIP